MNLPPAEHLQLEDDEPAQEVRAAFWAGFILATGNYLFWTCIIAGFALIN